MWGLFPRVWGTCLHCEFYRFIALIWRSIRTTIHVHPTGVSDQTSFRETKLHRFDEYHRSEVLEWKKEKRKKVLEWQKMNPTPMNYYYPGIEIDSNLLRHSAAQRYWMGCTTRGCRHNNLRFGNNCEITKSYENTAHTVRAAKENRPSLEDKLYCQQQQLATRFAWVQQNFLKIMSREDDWLPRRSEKICTELWRSRNWWWIWQCCSRHGPAPQKNCLSLDWGFIDSNNIVG